MNIDLKLVCLAVGIALVIEGMPYFLFAEKMPRILKSLASMPPRALRLMGFTSMALGLTLAWIMRR